MKKFFIIGGYSYKNPGDEAILKATIYRLSKFSANSFFYIWSDNIDFDIMFDRPINFKIVYWRIFPKFISDSLLSFFFNRIYTILYKLIRPIIYLFNKDKNFSDALYDSDIVISVGGGYLTDMYSLKEINFLIYLAKKFNKVSYLFGQTIGPFRRIFHVQMANEIFNSVQKIIIREKDSMKELVGFESKTIISFDDAISFTPAFNLNTIRSRFNLENNKLNIGLNLRLWNNSRDYYVEIAQLLFNLSEKINRKLVVYFIPMETHSNCNDLVEGKIFLEIINKRINFKLIDSNLTVEELSSFISEMDLFIGMRLHSLVFSLSNTVPSIGVYSGEYYKRKINGLFENFGLTDYSVDIANIKKIESLLNNLFTNSDYICEKLRIRSKEIEEYQNQVLTKTLGL